MGRLSLSLSLSLSLTTLSGEAYAQTPANCTDATFLPRNQYSRSQQGFDYRINIIGSTPQMTAGEIRRSVIAAADQWNESSGSATLTYLGTTTRTVGDYGGPAEPTLPQCDAAGLSFSTVVIHASENRPASWAGAMAKNTPHCYSSGPPVEAEGNYQFTIETYLHNTDGSLLIDVGSQTLVSDLAAVMFHEFGHSFNLKDEPTTSYASVMNPTAYEEVRGPRGRDAYPFDVNCAFRNRQPLNAARIQRSCAGGACAWSSPILLTNPLYRTFLTAGGGGRMVSGVFSIRWLGTEASDPDAPNLVGAPGSLGSEALSYAAPLFVPRAALGLWRDRDATRQRLLFVPPAQPSQNDVLDEFRLTQRTSTNDFSSATAVSIVNRCSSMPAWMACGSQQEIRTARAPSVAWASGSFPYNPTGVSITAWAEQVRGDTNNDGQVFIAISSVGEATLPKPDSAGVLSAVGPQVACRNAATSPRCVLVYAEQNPSYAVVARRFDIGVLSEFDPVDFRIEDRRYQTNFVGSAVSVGVFTSSRMALYYSTAESKYLLVMRAQAGGQPTQVFSSSDGAAWTQEANLGVYLDVGPYAPAYQVSTSNNLFIAAP